MSERLTQSDLIRFAYGQADELETVILADDEYIAALERIWESEMTDLTGPILKAIHVERLLSEGILAAIDTGTRLAQALTQYLAGTSVSSESDEATSEEPTERLEP